MDLQYHSQRGDHGRGRLGGHPSCPPEVRMTPPAADLPPEVKAFFGTWDGVLASRLVVEEIDATYARVVYAWGDDPQERFKGGWSRITAKVLPGGALQ